MTAMFLLRQSKTTENRKLQKFRDSRAECDQHSILSDAFVMTLVTPAIVSTTHLVWLLCCSNGVVRPTGAMLFELGAVGPLRASFDL